MKTVRIALLLSCAVLVASPLHAATIRIDAFAEYAFDTATSGPPAVPLIADAEGNVLNPTAGQSYAILLTISVSDLGTLPNGKSEKGLASMHFDVNLQGLFENSRLPGWNLAQQNVDLNGSPPGGCCVPLWLDLCDCGFGGSLENISVGVDVPDFQIGNNNFDLRQTVGQGDPWGLGHVYADYRGGGARMDISIYSFEVHDLETTFAGCGIALGDSVLFVPEPDS